jgi:hypothetical protein
VLLSLLWSRPLTPFLALLTDGGGGYGGQQGGYQGGGGYQAGGQGGCASHFISSKPPPATGADPRSTLVLYRRPAGLVRRLRLRPAGCRRLRRPAGWLYVASFASTPSDRVADFDLPLCADPQQGGYQQGGQGGGY